MTEQTYIQCDECGMEFPEDGIFDAYSGWDSCWKFFCIPCYADIRDFAFI